MTEDKAVIAEAGESAKVLEQVADGTMEEDDPKVAEARECRIEDEELLDDVTRLRKIQSLYYKKQVVRHRKNRNLAAMFRQGLLDDVDDTIRAKGKKANALVQKVRKKQDWRRKERRDLGRLWEHVLQSKMSIKDLDDVSPDDIAKAKDAYEWVMKKRASRLVRARKQRDRERAFRQQAGTANRKSSSKTKMDSDDEPLPRPGLQRVVDDAGSDDDDEPQARPSRQRIQTDGDSDASPRPRARQTLVHDDESDGGSDDEPLPPRRRGVPAFLRRVQHADDGDDQPLPRPPARQTLVHDDETDGGSDDEPLPPRRRGVPTSLRRVQHADDSDDQPLPLERAMTTGNPSPSLDTREEPPNTVKSSEASVIEISSDSSDSLTPRSPARKRRRVAPARYGDFADQGWFVEKMDRNLATEGRRLLEFGGPIFEEDDEEFIPADEAVAPDRALDVVPDRAPLEEVVNVGMRRSGLRKQDMDVIGQRFRISAIFSHDAETGRTGYWSSNVVDK
ncbi:hypothetical protein LTR13_004678 [Exophiala sideris]|uniref:Uncharacterized protein n=1 Tax=Exophiala sideris TaxID=1016849 RepID=A0ABR0J9H5_9EURO|nr:hypothetical protein LTR13_004678 [Exophiala sideris]KAK5059182.1 hypothetical protein LTR69_006471 [Exophiala sideris]KAK5183016.1 hypothetical protein LTR44_004726 [Eurotiomycetes sp. CCFEE 6388]